MLAVLKKIALGLAMILASAAILLYSDLDSRKANADNGASSARPLKVAIVQQTSIPALDDGLAGAIEALKERGYVDGGRMALRQYNAQGDITTGNAIAKEVTSGDFDLIFSLSTVSLQTVANANRFANGVLGGWQMQGIMVLHSGLPFTPTISRDVSNTGIGGQLPIRVGSGQLSNPAISDWFDKTAFALPANYTYGNSGSYILQADRFKNLDFSLFKSFQAGERLRINFRAETFNLTNSPTFNPPGTNIDTSSGGVVTSTLSAPRNIQLALKFNF